MVGGGYFVCAPPPSALCPIVKTQGVNYNRDVPSLCLSETTLGNALTQSLPHTLSHSLKSELLPVFHLFRLLSYNVRIDWPERGSPGNKKFALEEPRDKFPKTFGRRFFAAVVTFAPRGICRAPWGL